MNQEIKDEINFWHKQMLEHSLFMYLGLQPSAPFNPRELISNLSQNQPQADLKPTINATNDIEFLKDKAFNLVKDWAHFEKRIEGDIYDIQQLNILICETDFLFKRTLELQKQGAWVGWLYPSFIKHINRELNYFVHRINNTISKDEEILFWNEINADHAIFSTHLLDDGKAKEKATLVVTAFNLGRDGYDLNEEIETDFEQFAALTHIAKSLEYSHKVANFFKSASETDPESIIHPMLLAHVIREGQRSIQRLNLIRRS